MSSQDSNAELLGKIIGHTIGMFMKACFYALVVGLVIVAAKLAWNMV